MAEETVTPQAPAAPVSAPSAPQVETPVSVPVVPESPKVETPVAEPVKTETPKPEAAKTEPSLLGAEPKKAEPTKAETKTEPVKALEVKTDPAKAEIKAEGEKKEGDQSVETAPLPTYEPFTFPEGLKPDEGRLGDFTKMLGEFQNSKPDQAGFQKFGQSLVDFHVAEVKNAVEAVNKSNLAFWEKQGNDWLEASKKDPEIGGNRHETAVRSAVEFIEAHGGTAEQKSELRKLFNDTKIGNHPALVRLLSRANTAMAEGKPLPATAPVPQKMSKVQKMYGKKTG